MQGTEVFPAFDVREDVGLADELRLAGDAKGKLFETADDGVERVVFEDAEGGQFVKDHGEMVAGQWLPPADEPASVERQ
jgi:hypothetical protein